ncbi:DeoR/GlpR family DNA-binding transcription regulator [Erwiniaceae bacterium BAC15a-03b]|uniref:DeoR/GlpR family DNA-binding transcription regulator n=1 Tax=Winslowiella arboricola TaxID=2978220 RepID=A0A9J6PQ93_9GAMM|nr:DeoR/GlpR family DNA-binding transcription regulator [Winslowiella arboricola]MCU5772125.1 DeoR/GlpR family DNA-binding transcription regulator [Winslowiella arboricola]MCU5778539.1 DeoR/GlpR family DNA-binding transcription regulator [Winslowiella arboricola]
MLDYAAFPQQRQSLIRQKLLNEGRVTVTGLAAELQVSEHTIRRDLQELAREGVCKKVYGGAVSMVKESDSFINRSLAISAEKQRIASGCASLVKDGGSVFIDAGSTNLALARALPEHLQLTVVTNSPLIAVELMRYPHYEVIMLGGRVQPQTGGSLGVTPQSQLSDIWFDQCFLGGCAMDAEAGVTVFDFTDAEFKRTVVARSNEIIIALTAEKIPGIARYSVAQCADIAIMVVDKGIAAEKLTAFTGKNIRIERV